MSQAFHDLNKAQQVLFIDWMDQNNPDMWVTYEEIEERYEEMLNDIYDTVNVCGYNYSAGSALKELDPTAFRCGCSDWSAEEYIEIVTCSAPTRTLYIMSESLDGLVEEFQEEQESLIEEEV